MVIEVIQELRVEGGGRAVRVAISQTIIEGWTPLVIAAHHGWTAVCQILCDEFDAAAADARAASAADGVSMLGGCATVFGKYEAEVSLAAAHDDLKVRRRALFLLASLACENAAAAATIAVVVA